MKKYGFAVLLALVLNLSAGKAQIPPVMYFQPPAGTTVTNCGTPPVGSTPPLCGVATGWFVWNGTAWVQIGIITAAGVTSWNGLTGVVTYIPPTSPVTSVNGKTGAVTISAVATAPAVTLQ